ncbi:ATP-independent transporter subunit [Synergistales bacterium]|nr:ATP-independent transporter subunit [Synergistales bacterium]
MAIRPLIVYYEEAGVFLKKFDEVLYTVLCWACGLLIFGMMIVTFSQVVARYAFRQSLSWSEEVGRYTFIWISFLGLAAAFKSGSHVALDLLVKTLKGTPLRALRILNGALIVVLSSTILISGLKLFQVGMRQRSPALGLPMHMVYIVVPLSGLLILYFSLRALWESLHRRTEG